MVRLLARTMSTALLRSQIFARLVLGLSRKWSILKCAFSHAKKKKRVVKVSLSLINAIPCKCQRGLIVLGFYLRQRNSFDGCTCLASCVTHGSPSHSSSGEYLETDARAVSCPTCSLDVK